MAREPYVVELDPDTKTMLKMYLFQKVLNVEVIRNNIVQGVWNCAAIKPQLILDPLQVAVAANRAVLAHKQNAMVTRTLYSEILFNLSLSKNITQSLSKFGIENDTKNFLICFLVTEESDASKEILPQINGESLPMSDLKDFICKKTLNTVYKLNNVQNQDLVDVIVSRMVTKNFVTH